jgi:4'-phosphopantetheinyl transferase
MNIRFSDANALDLLNALDLPSEPPSPVLQLTAQHVHAWLFDLSRYTSRLGDFSLMLDAAEIKRAKRFLQQQDREWFVLAHGLVRLVLSRYLHLQPNEIRFAYGPHQKPSLDPNTHPTGCTFNYSHSGSKMLLVVTSQHDIGADIEQQRRLSNLDKLISAKCSSLEQAELHRLEPEQQRLAFFSLWARKEALTKAMGLGMRFPFQKISTYFKPQYPAPVTLSYPVDSTNTWTIYDLPDITGYASAMAVAGDTDHLTYFS